MVETLVLLPRVRERAPFNPAEYNRLVNWLNGHIAAPFALVDDTGALMMSSNPSVPNIVFFAPVTLSDTTTISGTLRLLNTLYLYSRNAADSADIGLIRLSATDIIELGPSATQRLTIVSPLTNNVAVNARNAANSANVALVLLDASDIIQLGAAGNRLTLNSPLTNNVGVFSRNAANSANVLLIGLNASDQIVVGAVGTSTFLTGTVIAPAIDPPTIDGQVTAESVAKAMYSGSVSGGVLTHRVTYNIATGSTVRNAAGDYTVTWSKAFATAFYTVQVTVEGTYRDARVNSKAAGSADIYFSTAGVLTDPDAFHVTASGTLA